MRAFAWSWDAGNASAGRIVVVERLRSWACLRARGSLEAGPKCEAVADCKIEPTCRTKLSFRGRREMRIGKLGKVMKAHSTAWPWQGGKRLGAAHSLPPLCKRLSSPRFGRGAVEVKTAMWEVPSRVGRVRPGRLVTCKQHRCPRTD